MIRAHAKVYIKQLLDKSEMGPLEKSLLNLGLANIPNDSPFLTVAGDVLNAIDLGNYDTARQILYTTADTLIEQLKAKNANQDPKGQ